MKKKTLLIIEANPTLCELVSTSFQEEENWEIIAMVHSGREGLRLIYEQSPDLVILDLAISGYDGISVLEALRDLPPRKSPKILVTSVSGQESVCRYAMALGASYYLRKPYKLNVLRDRIRMLLNENEPVRFLHMPEVFAKGKRTEIEIAEEFLSSKEAVSRSIAKILLRVGVPTNILGYPYISEALEQVLLEGSTVPMVKRVYSDIALRHNTTNTCVESAIRKAIAKTHENATPFYCRLLKAYGLLDHAKVPSNRRFLTILAEQIRFGLIELSPGDG